MNWLHYLLEANIYLTVFYLVYFIFLDKETHYKLNRAYLLITCVISYIIPVIQIGALKSYKNDGQIVTIITNSGLKPQKLDQAISLTITDYLLYAYIIGVAIMFTALILKFLQLKKLTRAKNGLLDNKYKLIKLEGSNTAFSFFNYVFIGTKVSRADTIIRHELVHINQKHSFDIVFLELIKIINWFNPFVYLLQRSLKTIHEYIADEHTAAYENDALTYSSFLVSNAYGVSGSSITHSFFNYNLLKKRIIMLNQKRSGSLARLKYLTALPVCAALICASTMGFSKTYGWITILPANNLADSKMLSKNNEQQTVKVAAKLNLPADTDKKIPPPPPAPPKHSTAPSLSSDKQAGAIKFPPPPPPALKPKSAFDNLSKYVAKNVRYPAAAMENKIMGSIIINFTVKNDQKLSNISLLKGINKDCDKEVMRVFNEFSGDVSATPGNYKIAVTYYLDGLKLSKTASGDLGLNDPSFAGEITVVGYPAK